MALNFDVSKVADFQTVTTYTKADGTKIWHPVTDSLIWLSIICGFNAITEANADEVASRISAWQRVNGAFLASTNGDIYITADDVRRHIGLSTNASKLTKAAFNKKLLAAALAKPVSNRDSKSAYEIVGNHD